jgi:hypothetical protein
MTPTARTLARLRTLGFTAAVVERWIPGANVRRDLFGCIDVIAVHPRDCVVLGVQATTAAHVADRRAKARALPELAAWLRAGGQFQVWGWCRLGGRWQPRVVTVQVEDLAAKVVQEPRRWRPHGRQMAPADLFGGELGPRTGEGRP